MLEESYKATTEKVFRFLSGTIDSFWRKATTGEVIKAQTSYVEMVNFLVERQWKFFRTDGKVENL